MIISRTPYRISFFGGGTDYPAWYLKHGGEVLATTINKYCYLSCRYLPPFFEHKYRVVYSLIENAQTLDRIAHPVVREVLRHLKWSRGLEIHHDGDLPARSGMGSSSAFTVGLLHSLWGLMGRMPSKSELAKESIRIEQELLKEAVGSQDQALAAYGGFNHITFSPGGEITVKPMILPAERIAELNSHLMLFYTGIKRTAADVAQSYMNHLDDRRPQMRIAKELVKESLSILSGGQNITAFGELLREAWLAKCSLSSMVSNPTIDDIYNRALSSGAIGGKLIGAGGGGFMLLFVPPDLQPKVKEKLKSLIQVPFKFETSGSQIIYYEAEEDYSVQERERDHQQISEFRELQGDPLGGKTHSEAS